MEQRMGWRCGTIASCLAVSLLALLPNGCSKKEPSPQPEVDRFKVVPKDAPKRARAGDGQQAGRPAGRPKGDRGDSGTGEWFSFPVAGEPATDGSRTQQPSTPFPPLPAIDRAAVAREGIRVLEGKYLTLYTDLPADPAVDELPSVFEQAVPQWCEYFHIDPSRVQAWHLVGSLMSDKTRFRKTGLLPGDLPPFLHGFQRDSQIWLYEQPTAYYRRHLLLHEGTHAFMAQNLGGQGPPWYWEGMAELLATHRWRDGRLTLHYFPSSREETAHWGRIKVIQDDMAAGKGKTLEAIMAYDERAHLKVEPYAWSWAAATFFDTLPDTRPAFRSLAARLEHGKEGFSDAFYHELQPSWRWIALQWELFVSEMDYGYDLTRELIEPTESHPLRKETAVTLSADRGWQSSGLRLEAGKTYRFRAEGRFQVAREPKIWWCEPNGVTLRYHRGLPLGILLGAILDEDQPTLDASSLVTPKPLGLATETTTATSGTLYLRINDAPSELADNEGQVTVRITPLNASPPDAPN